MGLPYKIQEFVAKYIDEGKTSKVFDVDVETLEKEELLAVIGYCRLEYRNACLTKKTE